MPSSGYPAEPRHDPAPADWVQPVTLEGRRVRLEPLTLGHLDDLAAAGSEPAIWAFTLARPAGREGIAAWIRAAITAREAGAELAFATVDRETGRAIGSTRFMSIVPAHRRLEIGWTWVAPAFQRSGANREAKLLQLAHAFEVLGANRVEFKTDARNEKSRAALLAIGATFEGIFRNHMIMPEGPLRDSAWYSVTIQEWGPVKAHIEASLSRARA